MSDGTRSPRSLAYNHPVYATPKEPLMTVELDQPLQATIIRLLEIRDTRQTLDAEETQLKSLVRQRIAVGGQGTVNGQTVVTVTPNRRFNPDLATKTLTPDLLALCTVSKIDPPTAKKTLPPALYDACMAEVGEPVVRLA